MTLFIYFYIYILLFHMTGFFELGMTDTSHPKCVVDCGTGEAVMEFEMKEPRKVGMITISYVHMYLRVRGYLTC